MGGAMVLGRWGITEVLGGGPAAALVQVIVAAALGLAVFLVGARALDIEDVDLLRRLLPKRLLRGRR
jgi:hypothetical protein